jgi:hypothetical protein
VALQEAITANERTYYEQGRELAVWQHRSHLGHQLQDVQARGVVYDVAKFAGRPLTPSERIRWQQATHALAAAGLVEVSSQRYVRPTEAGLAKAAELEALADA